MVIHVEKMYLCTDAIYKITHRSPELFRILWVRLVHFSNMATAASRCKDRKKVQCEFQSFATLGFNVFIPWKVHSEVLTKESLQTCTCLVPIFNPWGNHYYKLF